MWLNCLNLSNLSPVFITVVEKPLMCNRAYFRDLRHDTQCSAAAVASGWHLCVNLAGLEI